MAGLTFSKMVGIKTYAHCSALYILYNVKKINALQLLDTVILEYFNIKE